MLQKLEQDFSDDPEILAKTVEVLELGFRSELKNGGFPDFRDIESTFSKKKPYQGRDDIVQITEHCRHGDGTTTTNTLVVAKTADGWKVVAVPDSPHSCFHVVTLFMFAPPKMRTNKRLNVSGGSRRF